MGEILDKSYDSMASDEKDEVHYEIESDNEPPHDEVGDVLTVVKKGQVTKTILEVGFFISALKLFFIGWLRFGQTWQALRGHCLSQGFLYWEELEIYRFGRDKTDLR